MHTHVDFVPSAPPRSVTPLAGMALLASLPILWMLLGAAPAAAGDGTSRPSPPRTTPTAAQPDWSGEIIYFVMLDRFHDGNPANNPKPPLYSGDRKNWAMYWGGDIEGLIGHLDYIRNLGATAVWITPVVENVDTIATYGKRSFSSYHGYWARDFKRMSRYLGTEADFDRLVRECHARRLKLVLDIVVNHTNPIRQGENGVLFDDGRRVADYTHDPDGIFHHRGEIDWNAYIPEKWEGATIFDLADFAQENPWVDRYLKESFGAWVHRGVDGLRIDTARFVPAPWLATFGEAMRKRRPDLFMFGEWGEAGADVPGAIRFEKESGMAMLDFRLQTVLSRVLNEGRSFSEIERLLACDGNLRDAGSLVTFVDNHDMPRFMSSAISRGATEQDARNRLRVAMALVMTLRGIPCIYYGTEQYLHDETPTTWGKGNDPYNRQMMEGFGRVTPMTKLIRALADLRRNNAALRRGTTRILQADRNVFAFERTAGNDHVVVAVNRSGRNHLRLPTSLPDGVYPDEGGAVQQTDAVHALLNQAVVGPRTEVRDGHVEADLGPLEMGVWSSRTLVTREGSPGEGPAPCGRNPRERSNP